MAYTFSIDHGHHRTLKTFTGEISVKDVQQCISSTVHEHAAAYGHFLDASHAHLVLSCSEVRSLAGEFCKASKTEPFGPMVAVAVDPVTYGLFRMFSALISDTCDLHVFRTADAASDYLDAAIGCAQGDAAINALGR